MLPLFIPNDYMYERFKDKGTEKWEIYAWVIRDIIAKASGKPKLDVELKTKFDYELAVGYRKPAKEKSQ